MQSIRAHSGSDQSTELFNVFIAGTLGEAILIQVMKMATYFLHHSSQTIFKHPMIRAKYLEGKGCYHFVQNGGLDDLNEIYQLNYDTNAIREGFNYYVRKSI